MGSILGSIGIGILLGIVGGRLEVPGLTVVLVEQNIDFVREASPDFTMLENGLIVASGPIASLIDTLVHKHMAVCWPTPGVYQ